MEESAAYRKLGKLKNPTAESYPDFSDGVLRQSPEQ